MITMRLDLRHKQTGFGLVEILVALVISSFLIAGVVQAYLSNKQTYRLTEGISRLQENARYALKSFSRAMEPGGYQGCLEKEVDSYTNTLTDTAGYNFGVSVEGQDGDISDSEVPDEITLTRAAGGSAIPVTQPMVSQVAPIQLDATSSNYSQLRQYQVMTISDCYRAASFMITNDPQASGGTIRHAEGIVAPSGGPNPGQSNATRDLQNTFGAKTSSVATVYSAQSVTFSVGPDGDGDPWLLSNGEQLVEGVKNLQVTYGVAGPGGTRFQPASSALDWSTVESMRVELTLDTLERVTGEGDGKIEKTFGRTYRIRNQNP